MNLSRGWNLPNTTSGMRRRLPGQAPAVPRITTAAPRIPTLLPISVGGRCLQPMMKPFRHRTPLRCFGTGAQHPRPSAEETGSDRRRRDRGKDSPAWYADREARMSLPPNQRFGDVMSYDPNQTFRKLEVLNPKLLEGLDRLGIQRPTRIQVCISDRTPSWLFCLVQCNGFFFGSTHKKRTISGKPGRALLYSLTHPPFLYRAV